LVATALGTASGLLITIALTRTLGIARYGAVAVAISIASIVQALANFGLSNGASRMMSFAEAKGDPGRALRLLRSGIVGGAVTGLVGTGAMLLLGLAGLIEGPGVSTTVAILAPLVAASTLRSMLYGALRAYRDLKAMLILGIAVPLLDLVVVGFLVASGVRSVSAYAVALVVVAYVDLALVAVLLRRGRRIGPLKDFSFVDLKTLMAFALPLVITQLLLFAIQSADVLLLGILRGTTEAGLYAPVMRVAEAASKVLSAFPLLFVPIATAYVANGQEEKLKSLYLSVTKWGYALGFPIVLILAVAPSHLLPLLFGAPYAEMSTVARILAAGYLATLITGLNGVTLAALGAVKEMAIYSAAGMVVNVGVGILLISQLGPVGAAWSNTISYAFINVAFSIVLYRRTGITPFRRDTVALFAYSLLVAVPAVLIAELGWFSSGPRGLGLAAAAGALWLVGSMLGRPFRMEWAEMKQIITRRRWHGDPVATRSPNGPAVRHRQMHTRLDDIEARIQALESDLGGPAGPTP
jgi:O-antigen/teichoic acid export membrane protein